MENKSQMSILYDIVCTFCAVAVIASILSFTLLSDPAGAVVAQAPANFSSSSSSSKLADVNTAQVSAGIHQVSLNYQQADFSKCSVIGGDVDKDIVVLDCASAKSNKGLGSKI